MALLSEEFKKEKTVRKVVASQLNKNPVDNDDEGWMVGEGEYRGSISNIFRSLEKI
jgi:hypothetical protein